MLSSVFGSLLMMAVVILVIYCCCKRRKRMPQYINNIITVPVQPDNPQAPIPPMAGSKPYEPVTICCSKKYALI